MLLVSSWKTNQSKRLVNFHHARSALYWMDRKGTVATAKDEFVEQVQSLHHPFTSNKIRFHRGIVNHYLVRTMINWRLFSHLETLFFFLRSVLTLGIGEKKRNEKEKMYKILRKYLHWQRDIGREKEPAETWKKERKRWVCIIVYESPSIYGLM